MKEDGITITSIYREIKSWEEQESFVRTAGSFSISFTLAYVIRVAKEDATRAVWNTKTND